VNIAGKFIFWQKEMNFILGIAIFKKLGYLIGKQARAIRMLRFGT